MPEEDICRHDGEPCYHSSDCAVHSEPAEPAGPCSCKVGAPKQVQIALSLGKRRVRHHFNPSELPSVKTVKGDCARVIDMMDRLILVAADADGRNPTAAGLRTQGHGGSLRLVCQGPDC